MILTLFAFAFAALSFVLLALNLRSVAEDTAASLRQAARRTRDYGRLAPNLAFCCLWLLVFALSYG